MWTVEHNDNGGVSRSEVRFMDLKGPSSSVLNGFLGLGTAEILCVAISAMIFWVWVKHKLQILLSVHAIETICMH